jgi:hypothetical protein
MQIFVQVQVERKENLKKYLLPLGARLHPRVIKLWTLSPIA